MVVHSKAPPKMETLTVCFNCGKETTVPFKPTQGRPVLCRECFQEEDLGVVCVAEVVGVTSTQKCSALLPKASAFGGDHGIGCKFQGQINSRPVIILNSVWQGFNSPTPTMHRSPPPASSHSSKAAP